MYSGAIINRNWDGIIEQAICLLGIQNKKNTAKNIFRPKWGYFSFFFYTRFFLSHDPFSCAAVACDRKREWGEEKKREGERESKREREKEQKWGWCRKMCIMASNKNFHTSQDCPWSLSLMGITEEVKVWCYGTRVHIGGQRHHDLILVAFFLICLSP